MYYYVYLRADIITLYRRACGKYTNQFFILIRTYCAARTKTMRCSRFIIRFFIFFAVQNNCLCVRTAVYTTVNTTIFRDVT